MNATISDAEEMVYNQDKLFSDMDSLLMMQKVRLIFFNENSTHTAISYTWIKKKMQNVQWSFCNENFLFLNYLCVSYIYICVCVCLLMPVVVVATVVVVVYLVNLIINVLFAI